MTGMTAQAVGSGVGKEVRAVLLRALIVSAVAGIGLVVLQWPIRELGVTLLGGSAEVQAATRTYFDWRIYCSPFTLINYAILGWLLGLGRAGTGLLVQTVLNVVNIVLSILCVMGFGWGIAGVTFVTFLAQVVTAMVGRMVVWRSFANTTMPSLQRIFSRGRIARMFGLNQDIMIRSFTCSSCSSPSSPRTARHRAT
ncbi:MATE family efflux transporter [Breoghania sp.]|uniref:MATE family efflux transporter n=1 Tax=Breoghania sp. TaxID=2065378 RepID=UPI003204E3CA